MTYSLGSIFVHEPGQVVRLIEDAWEDAATRLPTNELARAEMVDHVRLASRTLVAVLGSNALGRGPWTVAIYGHANREHTTGESLTITINSVPLPSVQTGTTATTTTPEPSPEPTPASTEPPPPSTPEPSEPPDSTA